MRRAIGVILASIAFAACERGAVDRAAATRTQSGDTTYVFSDKDGVWGPAHDAVVVFSVPTDTRETSFGEVRGLAALRDGGVVVFDAKSPAGKLIRQFDASGKFVRNIGRAGQGPGEYDQDNLQFSVHRNGTLLVRNEMRGLIRYAADGKYSGGFSLNAGGGFSGVVGGDDGSIFLPATYPFGTQMPRGRTHIIHYDSTGATLDTIAPGSPWMAAVPTSRGPNIARESWSALPDGRVVIGRSDKLAFLLVDPKGKTAPLIGEHSTVPVKFLPEEIAEFRANNAKERQGVTVNGERIPPRPDMSDDIGETKLPSSGMPQADADGRIWLSKTVESVKVEPFCVSFVDDTCIAKRSYRGAAPVFVAFKVDGTYLGEVRFPRNARSMAFTGQFAWAIVPDDDGVDVLTKFRLY